MARKIDIAIVTENVIMIDGIRAWTAQVGDIRLVAAAATADGLLLAMTMSPDVMILDLCRQDQVEPAAEARRLIGERYRVLVIGTRCDPDAVLTAHAAGALGYVMREQNLADLAVAIRDVATVDLLGPPRIIGAIAGGPREYQRHVPHPAPRARFREPASSGLSGQSGR